MKTPNMIQNTRALLWRQTKQIFKIGRPMRLNQLLNYFKS